MNSDTDLIRVSYTTTLADGTTVPMANSRIIVFAVRVS